RLACPSGIESPYSLLPYPIKSPFRFSQHMIPLTLPTQQQLLDSHIAYYPESNIRSYYRQRWQCLAFPLALITLSPIQKVYARGYA
ncbi:hypothetical protein, partial [Paenibacillus terrae]